MTATTAPADAPRRVTPRQAEAVAQACRLIAAAESPPALAELAAATGFSAWHLQRLFKRATGLSPLAWARAEQARRLRTALHDAPSVTAAIADAGYGSSSRVYEQGERLLGMTPGRYRAGGAGQRLLFAVGQCALGALLVAESDRGICAILLGDDPAALVQDLEARFPAAELVGGDAGFEARLALVAGFVEAPATAFPLPLDLQGTAFQHRVWQALRAIPPGQTLSYAVLAERIGRPGAARAVAGACAANPLAVAVPCHRIVRADGALSGYRWGVERKRELLRREGTEVSKD